MSRAATGEDQVRHAQPDARQIQQRAGDLHRPGRLHPPETVAQPGDLVRQPLVAASRLRGRRAFEMKRRGPPPGSPQDVGVELPAGPAGIENRQQQRQPQTVGGHGAEQAERAVDLDAAAAVRQAGGQVQQPVELQPPEEQAQAARSGPPQRDDDAHRPQQDRLLLRGLVGGEQRGGAERIEPGEDVVLLQVGEQRVPRVLRRQAELGRRRRDHRLGIERLRVGQGAPRRRGPDEDGPPERGRVHVVPRLEHAAVPDQLPQPPDQPVVGRMVGHVVARGLESRPGAADGRPGGRHVALGDDEQPFLLGRAQRRHFDAAGAVPRPHQVGRQHRAPAGCRGRRGAPPVRGSAAAIALLRPIADEQADGGRSIRAPSSLHRAPAPDRRRTRPAESVAAKFSRRHPAPAAGRW